ncbi:MAG: hypothetical protein WA888_03515 [Burkholderiaceae bacterium]
MSVIWLALITAFIPVVAVHISLVLAISAEAIPACVPYLEGCASISATGRNAPASYVFKPVLTVQSGLLCLYWSLNARWLNLMSTGEETQGRSFPVIVLLGYGAATSLIIYVTFLGTNEPFYQLMRRFGIYGYFLGTVLAQIWLALATQRVGKAHGVALCQNIGRLQLVCALFPFLLGILNLLLKAVLPEAQADRYENIIEWVAAAMMQVGIGLTYWSWRATRFRLYAAAG